MLRWLACCLTVWLCAAGAALATCPAPIVVHRKAVVHHDVVAAVATVVPVAVFQPVAVAVPAYAASYVPPAAPAVTPVTPTPAPTPTPAAQPGIAEVLAELKRLNGRLDALEKGTPAPAPAPTPAPKPSDPFNPGASANVIKPAAPAAPAGNAHLAVFAAKCAVCHQKGKEEKEGGGFVLTNADGSPVTLDGDHRAAMYKHIDKATMPKRNNKYGLQPLTEEEAGAVLDWLATLK